MKEHLFDQATISLKYMNYIWSGFIYESFNIISINVPNLQVGDQVDILDYKCTPGTTKITHIKDNIIMLEYPKNINKKNPFLKVGFNYCESPLILHHTSRFIGALDNHNRKWIFNNLDDTIVGAPIVDNDYYVIGIVDKVKVNEVGKLYGLNKYEIEWSSLDNLYREP